MLMQIGSLEGLLSDEALGVHAAWVWLIEVASAHKDTSQPNPNTIHTCVCVSRPLVSERANERSLSQARSGVSSCGGGLLSFLPVLPVSEFLFLSIFWLLYPPWTQHGSKTQPHFHFSLTSSSIFIYQLISILYGHICLFLISVLSHQTPAVTYSKSHSVNLPLCRQYFFLVSKNTQPCHTSDPRRPPR